MSYDLITIGRVSLDLHAQDIGVPFEEVTGFDTMVGGSPTNIAIGAARLGLSSIAFTAVGDDLAGDFVLRYLADAAVETAYVARKPGARTPLAMVAVLPPDRFPLSFYRENPADILLTVDDASALPFADTRALLLSGNAFRRGTCVDAARYCAEQARHSDLTTYLDLDLRPTEWSDTADYGTAIRSILPLVDVAVGTEEEFFAALAVDPGLVMTGAQLGASERITLDQLLEAESRRGTVHTMVVKRGPSGVSIVSSDERLDVPGFDVEAVNTIGAGDAFAAGLIRSRLEGWDWSRSARFANACGAIQVTRHGCSEALPTMADVSSFVDARGGL